MRKLQETGLDFVVDKLTNSIENVVTGDSFATEISVLTTADLKTVSKTKGWLFNWKEEFKQPAREIYKLTIVHNPKIIQGLISLEVKVDHVYMHLLESAPFNMGKSKCTLGFLRTLLPLLVNFPFSEDTKAMFHFCQKRN